MPHERRATRRVRSERPRLTVVSRIFTPEPSAASLRLSALTRALADHGVELRVLTTTPSAKVPYTIDDDWRITVKRWPAIRDRSGYLRGYLPYISFDFPLFFRILFGDTRDVYVCEPPPTTGIVLRIAAALRRTPYVYYAADIWSDAAAATGAPRVIVRLVRAVEKAALRGAAMVLVVTEGVQHRVEELAPDAPTAVVGHGVDLTRFNESGPAVEEPADVVYVGTASEWHGAELAIAALAKVMHDDPSITAAFVGQGSSWDTLQERARECGIADRVRFLDPVAPEEAAAWLRSARVSLATLVPGQGYDFAVPTKLYASLAVGTPVAYAGPDPVRRMINAEHLGIASEFDEDAFADAIRVELDKDAHRPDSWLVTWARENVAADAVAKRSAAEILQVVPDDH